MLLLINNLKEREGKVNVIMYMYIITCNSQKNKKPEPEENINFLNSELVLLLDSYFRISLKSHLIDNVDRKDTESVSPHQSSSWAKLVKGALRHLREYPRHRVTSVFRIVLHHRDNLQSIFSKLTI